MKTILFRYGLIAGLLILAGCCTRSEPVTVYLRDTTTKIPIAGATVEANPLIGFDPFVPGSCRTSDIGKTKQNGSVRLTVTHGYKLTITIASAAYPRVWVDAQHPADAGDTGWIQTVLERDWAAPAPIEIKIKREDVLSK